jgi:hypothetical protein
MNIRRVGMTLTILVVAVVLTAAPASATCPPYEGCTPGFWKRNLDYWEPTGVSPDTPLSAVGIDLELLKFYGLDSDTFLDALGYHGGRGPAGGARILLRATAAGYLNAAHPDVEYPWGWSEAAVNEINALLASGDREAMIDVAKILDEANNLGATF